MFPIALFLAFLSIKIWQPDIYNFIVQEDTAIEWIQASFFFTASVFSFLVFSRFFKRRLVVHSILYGALTMGLFFIAMEEISWGQRIFNFETMGYFSKHNMQKEITLHNLDKVAPLLSKLYIMIGLYGTFGWLLASRTRLKERIPLVNFYVPDWSLAPYFFFVFLIYFVLSYIRPFAVEELGIEELRAGHFIIFRDQEPAELLLSIGFLLFVAVSYMRIRKMESENKMVQKGFSSFKAKPDLKKVKPRSKDRNPLLVRKEERSQSLHQQNKKH